MAPIRGSVVLPAEIFVGGDVLGIAVRATIGSISCELTFPIAAGSRALVAPPGFDGLPRPGGCWGFGASGGWDISALGIDVDESVEAVDLLRGFDPWLDIARSWMNAKRRLPNAFRSGRETRVNLCRDGRIVGFHEMQQVHLLTGVAGASRVEVEAACALASRSERPPLPHSLLLEAFSALVVLDYRRAIIDAVTASEVALASFIGERFRSAAISDEAISAIVVQANGVVGLYKLCKAIGLQCDVSNGVVANELAARRNKVAHAGQTMSNADAAAVVTHSRTIVESATPLQFP